jgi:hypothetical protein
MRLVVPYRSVTRFWQVALISRGLALRFPLLCCSLHLVTHRVNALNRSGSPALGARELGPNGRACAPSRMTPPNRPLFWIASLRGRATIHPPTFGAPCVVGRPARKTSGLVAAAMSGIRSTQEECAPPVFTSGLRHSSCLAPTGRRTPTGMHVDSRQVFTRTGNIQPPSRALLKSWLMWS